MTHNAIDTIEAHYKALIAGLRAENNRLRQMLQEIRREIDHEGDYYDANVSAEIAEGLYMAVQIIDKHMKGGE